MDIMGKGILQPRHAQIVITDAWCRPVVTDVAWEEGQHPSLTGLVGEF